MKLSELKEPKPLSKNSSLQRLEELLEESKGGPSNSHYITVDPDECEGMMDTEENAVIDGFSIERKIRSTSIAAINKSTPPPLTRAPGSVWRMLNTADFEEDSGHTSVRHNCMSTERYRLVLIQRGITNLDLSTRRKAHLRPKTFQKRGNEKVFCTRRYLYRLQRKGPCARSRSRARA